MEFPNIGERCSDPTCKQLDFIPLKCLCQRFFCRDHFTTHCLSGECEHYSKQKNEPNFTESSPVYKCAFSKCVSSSYIKMPCLKCTKHFCIDHRFHPECPEIDPEVLKAEKERWEQPRAAFNKAKEQVEADVTKKLLITQQQSSAKAKTALKVQLMRLKSSAKGETTIPQIDRIYFGITKPLNNTPKTIISTPSDGNSLYTGDQNSYISTYVSINWSIGRVIDCVADFCKVKNSNDKNSMPKLRLFRKSDGLCLGIDRMDVKLFDILSKDIVANGDMLILEYIKIEDHSLFSNDEIYLIMQ